jgi:adenylate kinase family enzyme
MSMNIIKYKEKKIFVTGISGSGKTTFAHEYSKKFNYPYINFDENWRYYKPPEEEFNEIIKKYTNEFITDAIPFGTTNGRYMFLDYYESQKNDIKIVSVCCTNQEEFMKRMSQKKYKLTDPYGEYYCFYFVTLKNIYSGLNIEYFDSYLNEFITEEELYKRIDWINKTDILS